MNIKRIIFWVIFVIVLGLIVWGLAVAMNKPLNTEPTLGVPSDVTLTDHARGPADAPVTIIEYSDFQCPACEAYYPLIERLIAEASTTVRYVYRHYPLYPMPHKNAMIAAQATEAADLQGKFWDMYRLVFENQKSWENASNAAALFEEYAQRIGLNVATYKNDVNSDRVKARVQKDRDEGTALGIRGTPTFFINGKVITNPNGYEAFKALVQATAQAAAN